MRLELAAPYAITQTGLGDWMLYNPRDQYIGRSFDRYGQFSMAELALLASGTEAGHTVVDIGANIGAFTIPLARRATRVVAIEAQRLIHQMLCANVALNGLTNVLTLHAAAGRVSGRQIDVPRLDPMQPANFGGLHVDGHEAGPGTESVEMMRVDDLGLDACHLVKIDVEGMEKEAILGAQSTIQRHAPALYIENDRPEKSRALLEVLFDLGYVCHWHTPPLYDPLNARREAENLFPGIVSINLLCWHKDRMPPIAETLAGVRVAGAGETIEEGQAKIGADRERRLSEQRAQVEADRRLAEKASDAQRELNEYVRERAA